MSYAVLWLISGNSGILKINVIWVNIRLEFTKKFT